MANQQTVVDPPMAPETAKLDPYLTKKAVGMQMLDTLVHLEHMDELSSLGREKYAKFHKLGKYSDKPGTTAEGEAVGHNVGDVIYHIHEAIKVADKSTAKPADGSLSTLAKAAIIGSALLGTGGLGAGIAAFFLKQAPTIIQKLDPSNYDIDGVVTPIEGQ